MTFEGAVLMAQLEAIRIVDPIGTALAYKRQDEQNLRDRERFEREIAELRKMLP